MLHDEVHTELWSGNPPESDGLTDDRRKCLAGQKMGCIVFEDARGRRRGELSRDTRRGIIGSRHAMLPRDSKLGLGLIRFEAFQERWTLVP